MAHFAEIDKDNKVLRVVVACNQDIADNGGEQSAQAAEHFKKTLALKHGVKWVQTSYNNNFRKQFAGRGLTYDAAKDKFIGAQPYASWTLDGNDDWEAPIAFPSVITDAGNGDIPLIIITWDEDNQKWIAKKVNDSDGVLIDIEWNPGTSSWNTV
tara:strand:- start:1504 stop:1968 length:465 start_codon:yes stop_codon:yes gene_type:complete